MLPRLSNSGRACDTWDMMKKTTVGSLFAMVDKLGINPIYTRATPSLMDTTLDAFVTVVCANYMATKTAHGDAMRPIPMTHATNEIDGIFTMYGPVLDGIYWARQRV